MSLKKIVIIGPESTGKSTLSSEIAAALNTCFVPEFAREYLHQINREYLEEDLLHIAAGQLKLEDKLAREAKRLLICDTDLYVIKVWSEHKYNHCPVSILQTIAERPYDLYILTSIDMPWEDDPLREHPEPEMRTYFFNIYKDIVQNSGVPWILVEGTPQQRLAQSLQEIQNLLQPPVL